MNNELLRTLCSSPIIAVYFITPHHFFYIGWSYFILLIDTISPFYLQVDTEFLQTMCQRLFANQLRQSVSGSVDLKRPGTAGNMLRQSIAVNKVRVKVKLTMKLH